MRHDPDPTVSTPVRFFRQIAAACRRLSVAAATLTLGALLSSCTGDPSIPQCLNCVFSDAAFYADTRIIVSPNRVELAPEQSGSADIVVVYRISADYDFANFDATPHAVPGLTINLVSTDPRTPVGTTVPNCTIADFPAGLAPNDPQNFACRHFRLDVGALAATGDYDFVLAAQFTASLNQPVIERVEPLRVAVALPAAPPTPDFQIAVSPVPGVYGTRATVPVSINRSNGFAEGVTLEFSGLTSGVVGSFAVEPVPTDRRSLELQIPARYAGGGLVDLRVTARSASGVIKTVNFSQNIEPLFRMFLQPESATLTTAEPLRIDVGVKAGDLFRTPSIGPVELSISPSTPLPPWVTARFLDDATPTVPVLPVQTVSRVLQLVTDGSFGIRGVFQIRGTARGVPPDPDGVQPFIEVTLNLDVQDGQFWQFVGNNLTYGTRESNVIGTALQSDDRPVLAWLEGTTGRVFVRRYDGTTFAPSPPLVDLGFGLTAPALSVMSGIAEASFALTASDAAQVAFTYDSGARLALGRANRAGVDWSASPSFAVGNPADAATPRARSPRIATGPVADLVVVSYIQEANAATTTGGVLHVLRTFGNGVLTELPTALPGGALNALPTGSAVRHATALALRADGNPWVAWIEEPTNPMFPHRLYLRAYDGNDWGPAIAVPTPGTPVGASVQLLVEPSGTVVVAWLEGSPAQLKLSRYDPSNQGWTRLDNTGNAAGSLNVTALSPALDVYLARETGAQGRLLVTWTEGGAFPAVWIKRQNANGSWALVGTTVSQADRWAKTPRIVSDSNHRLYVAWATYAAGQNPSTFLPYAEIDVAQWIFP